MFKKKCIFNSYTMHYASNFKINMNKMQSQNLLYINITIHSEKFHFYQQLQSLLYIDITIHSRKFHFIILIKVIIL